MEINLENSLTDIDTDDTKYLCGPSTILVAHIQELKDRISQIELIFCNQLFPGFQSRSRLLQRRILEAEDEWKKKENTLYCQIDDLLHEKQRAQEQIQQMNISLEESKRRLMDSEQLLRKQECEIEELLNRLPSLERNKEIIESLKEQIQQLNTSLKESNTRLMSSERLLNRHEFESKQLLNKLENVERDEEIIARLKEQLEQKTDEVAKGKEVQEKLQKQIHLKDHKLSIEQNKRNNLARDYTELITRYKSVKSQYTFLLGKKIADCKEDVSQLERMDEKGSPRPYLNNRSLQDSRNKDEASCASAPPKSKTRNICQEKLGEGVDIGFEETSAINSHASVPSGPRSLPPKPVTGLKRGASWRDTRARGEPGGADPHDDFLDTPMEIVRNLDMGPQDEVQDLPVLALRDMDCNNSDDETQEIKAETIPNKQHISVLGPAANKSFKYVEPVRKKAERENLKGVECKQCKKFYDAVLPDGRESGALCEHHDGVSRHRYRYAPPLTPEGFWNIGFESDL